MLFIQILLPLVMSFPSSLITDVEYKEMNDDVFSLDSPLSFVEKLGSLDPVPSVEAKASAEPIARRISNSAIFTEELGSRKMEFMEITNSTTCRDLYIEFSEGKFGHLALRTFLPENGDISFLTATLSKIDLVRFMIRLCIFVEIESITSRGFPYTLKIAFDILDLMKGSGTFKDLAHRLMKDPDSTISKLKT